LIDQKLLPKELCHFMPASEHRPDHQLVERMGKVQLLLAAPIAKW
jgi:hypothetical protein